MRFGDVTIGIGVGTVLGFALAPNIAHVVIVVITCCVLGFVWEFTRDV